MTEIEKALTHANLTAALAAAQGEMDNATLNKVNPHFRSKYADLAAVRNATIPFLSKHGLAILQTTEIANGHLILRTRLEHISGEFREGCWPLPMVIDKPQTMSSAMTYGKRITWCAICGIAADEDDDAEAAEGRGNANAADGNTITSSKSKADRPITPDQKAQIVAKQKEVGADTAAFLKYLGVASLDALPARSFDAAMDALAKKARTNAA